MEVRTLISVQIDGLHRNLPDGDAPACAVQQDICLVLIPFTGNFQHLGQQPRGEGPQTGLRIVNRRTRREAEHASGDGVAESAAERRCGGLSPAAQVQRIRMRGGLRAEPDGVLRPVLSVAVQRDNYIILTRLVKQAGERRFQRVPLSSVGLIRNHAGRPRGFPERPGIRLPAPVIDDHCLKAPLSHVRRKLNQSFVRLIGRYHSIVHTHLSVLCSSPCTGRSQMLTEKSIFSFPAKILVSQPQNIRKTHESAAAFTALAPPAHRFPLQSIES